VSKSYASAIRFLSQQMHVEKVLPTDGSRKMLLIKVEEQAHTSLLSVVDNLTQDSDRGLETIHRMLAAMRKSVSNSDFQVCSMQTCVNNALALYGFDEHQKAHLSVDVVQDFEFYGSEYYVHHILFNLLKNSYKYCHRDCTIEIILKKNTLRFRDNGPGIAEKVRPYVFDHFFTTDTMGTGIGLAFCRLIMEEFGGMIVCMSRQGEDSFTEFVLTFPKVTQQQKEGALQKTA